MEICCVACRASVNVSHGWGEFDHSLLCPSSVVSMLCIQISAHLVLQYFIVKYDGSCWHKYLCLLLLCSMSVHHGYLFVVKLHSTLLYFSVLSVGCGL